MQVLARRGRSSPNREHRKQFAINIASTYFKHHIAFFPIVKISVCPYIGYLYRKKNHHIVNHIFFLDIATSHT